MRLSRTLPCLLFAGGLFACAQTTYTAARIDFNHHGLFTQKQLEDAAGMHAGTSFTADDLAAAAQRLADTGYFETVGATLAPGKVSSITVKFDIKPLDAAQMLHIGFVNFVWLTHDEIETAIKAKFPMFIDYLPENSPQQDAIKEALIQALAAKGVTADVSYDTFEPTLRHPVREIAFKISKPAIRVANVKLGEVSRDLVPYVQKSVNATARTPYIDGPADETTSDRILAPLLDAGYVKAALTEVTLDPSPAADGIVPIVLSAELHAGEIYHVSSVTFTGTPLFSADAFAAAAKLHPGDIAAYSALLATLTPLDAAYRRLGYMDVTIHAAPALDTANHTVAYTVTVESGEQYRVKQVTVNNLDPAARADFDRGFLMKQDDLYNPEYLTTFLKKNTALKALEGYSATFKAYADPGTHTVDVVINFYRGVPR